MGLISWFLGNESYDSGSEWAETLHEVDADVSPGQVEQMGRDLSEDPSSFYNGFRDEWNSYPDVEPARGFWSKLLGG